MKMTGFQNTLSEKGMLLSIIDLENVEFLKFVNLCQSIAKLLNVTVELSESVCTCGIQDIFFL